MSIRQSVACQYDRLLLRGASVTRGDALESIALTPVFHVEKLHIDRHFDELLRFLREFRVLTGLRAVVTCMTPHSPILAMQLRAAGYSDCAYWDRIARLGENGIVGLHGHYVRSLRDARVVPMHYAFHDLSIVERQIGEELDGLKQRCLVMDNLLIYSGGWWFVSDGLRTILASFGFAWDYSVSSNDFNISPGSYALGVRRMGGMMTETVDGRVIRSAVAVSGLARKGRPHQSIGKILAEHRLYPTGPVTLSLYSHDYDLDCDAALAMVRDYLGAGLCFAEPS